MTNVVSFARVVVTWGDGTQLAMRLVGEDAPDLAVVDTLTRLQMAVRRVGGLVRVEELSSSLEELLDLVGLLGEMCGQIERREELLDLEEGVDS
jgi:hypothetical protein